MGTGSLTAKSDGQTIYASHVNNLQNAIKTDFVPRNSGGNPTDQAGSLGTTVYRWLTLNCINLVVGGQTVDVTDIAGAANRIISGAETSEGHPNFLVPAGVAGGLTGTIDGTPTNLVMVIDSASVTVSTDITVGSQTAAPTSNNTVTVNEPSWNDDDYTKYIGEFHEENNYVINFDAGGSEIDTLTGTIQPFKKGNEVFYALITSSSGVGTLKPILRGIAGTDRETIADNDTITLLRAEHTFIDNDALTSDKTTIFPHWGQASPSGPTAGQYWFDIANQTWKRYSGSVWEQFGRLYLGAFINDGTDTLWAEHQNFSKGFKDKSEMRVRVKDNNTVTILGGSFLDVSGTNIYWGQDLDFALSTGLDTGSEAASTRYWLYVQDSGLLKFSKERPRPSEDGMFRYHPYKYWRAIFSVYNDGSSNIDADGDKSYPMTSSSPVPDPEGQRYIEKYESIVMDDVERLRTNMLLLTDHFPDTNNLVVYHMNGQADYYGGAAIDVGGFGSLTENGTGLTSSTNHLGKTCFCNFSGDSGSDYLNSSDTAFDNTSYFSVGAWIRPDNLTNGDVIFGKYDSGLNKRAWRCFITTNAIRFALSTDGSTVVDTEASYEGLDDGNYHHLACVYDAVAKTAMIMIDGRITAYQYDATLGSIFDDGTADFAVGASYSGGSPLAGSYFPGDITEIFYKRTVLTANQIRKIYAAGCRKMATVDGNNKISINDSRCVLGEYRIKPADKTLSTGNITETELYIPEAGFYKYIFNARVRVTDNGASGDANVQYRIYDNTNSLALTETKVSGFAASTASKSHQPIEHVETPPMYFAKDTHILMNVVSITSGDVALFEDMDIWWEKLD